MRVAFKTSPQSTSWDDMRFSPDDPKAVAAEAEAFAEAGLDLGIVYLPPPHTPAVLETIAEAVSAI